MIDLQITGRDLRLIRDAVLAETRSVATIGRSYPQFSASVGLLKTLMEI